MEDFNKYWEIVQQFGPPAMAIIFALTLLSVNFYFTGKKEIKAMEKFFLKNKTLIGFKLKNESSDLFSIGLFEIPQLIENFKKPEQEEKLKKFKVYNDKVSYLKSLKRFYLISFTSTILLTIIGLVLNEFVN